MISFKGVSKIFTNQTVITNLSFSIHKGEIVGLLGRNGAGKTTTMRLLTGYLVPSHGAIKIAGFDSQTKTNVYKNQIGYLPENNPLWTELKVGEYLQFIATLKNVSFSNIEPIIISCSLEKVLWQRIENLSRGFKQRVGLAAALISYPEILVLDEPTSGLDPIEQQKINALIKVLGKNKTILFSTHILSEIQEVCSRVIILDQGKMVYDGKIPKRKDDLKKLFFSKTNEL